MEAIQNTMISRVLQVERGLHKDCSMNDRDEQFGGYDIGLAVLVVTTAWLLIFQLGR
jgi:hypothetical protein